MLPACFKGEQMKQKYSWRQCTTPIGQKDYYQVIDLTSGKYVGKKYFYKNELSRAKAFNNAKIDAMEMNK